MLGTDRRCTHPPSAPKRQRRIFRGASTAGLPAGRWHRATDFRTSCFDWPNGVGRGAQQSASNGPRLRSHQPSRAYRCARQREPARGRRAVFRPEAPRPIARRPQSGPRAQPHERRDQYPCRQNRDFNGHYTSGARRQIFLEIAIKLFTSAGHGRRLSRGAGTDKRIHRQCILC